MKTVIGIDQPDHLFGGRRGSAAENEGRAGAGWEPIGSVRASNCRRLYDDADETGQRWIPGNLAQQADGRLRFDIVSNPNSGDVDPLWGDVGHLTTRHTGGALPADSPRHGIAVSLEDEMRRRGCGQDRA